MEKNEQTNGGSSLNIFEFTTNDKKELNVPPKKVKKLTLATMQYFNQLNADGFLEIQAESHEVYKDSKGKVQARIDSKTGKVITGKLPKTKTEELSK